MVSNSRWRRTRSRVAWVESNKPWIPSRMNARGSRTNTAKTVKGRVGRKTWPARQGTNSQRKRGTTPTSTTYATRGGDNFEPRSAMFNATTGDATNYFHCQSLPTPSTNCDSTHLPIIQCHDALTFDSRYYNADRCSGSYKHVNHGEIPPCCQPRGVRDLFLTYFSYCSIWCVFLDESRSTDLVSRGPVDRVARMLCTWHLTQLTAGVRLWDIGESSCVCLG